MKCVKCYKAEALDSWWERIKAFFAFRIFGEYISDEKSASYTAGFGEGYVKGNESAKEMSEAVITALGERVKELQRAEINPDLLINPHEVISWNPQKNEVKLGKEVITPQEAQQLKDMAVSLKDSRLYSVFLNTVKFQATELGFTRSKNYEETLSGRTMVKNLEILRDIVELCTGLRVDKD